MRRWRRERVVGQGDCVEDMLGRNVGILVLRRGAAAAERRAWRNNALLRLSVCLRVRQSAAHLRRVREVLRRISLRSDMSVGVRRWEAGAWLGVGVVLRAVGEIAVAVVFARSHPDLDAIARLDHVGLERDGSWAAV